MLDVLVQYLCGVKVEYCIPNLAPDSVGVSVTGRTTGIALAVIMLETFDTLEVICQLPAPSSRSKSLPYSVYRVPG